MPVGVDTYTKLLMHCEGSDASTTFRDGSSTHRALTSSGASAQIDTAQYKFGAASGLFNSGYVYAGDSTDWHFTEDFTIDAWVRHSSLPSDGSHQMYMSQYVNTSTHWNFRISRSGGNYILKYEHVYSGSAKVTFSSSALTISVNNWYHVALVKNGDVYKLYFGGVEKGTVTDADALVDLSSSLFVGSWGAGGYYFYGWMDEVRVSKGIARWTENFTPPTEAYWLEDTLTDDFNTHDESSGDTTDLEVTSDVKLLLHGNDADASTTVRDSSPTRRTITVYGNAQIDTAQSVFGGASILFDGTGDYLTAPDSDDWSFSTGDFTIDLRVRFNTLPSASAFAMLVSQYQDESNYWRIGLYNSAGEYKLYVQSNGGSGGNISVGRTFGVATGTWYHFAVTKAGVSIKWFLDGAQVSTEYTTSYGFSANTGVLNIGSWAGGGEFLDGWIDELRIIKGKAIWTSSFTLPTVAYAILDGLIDSVASADTFATDPGMKTDAEMVEALTTADIVDFLAGIEYEGVIDEDIVLSDSNVVNHNFGYCVIVGTANLSAVVKVEGDYSKTMTEDVTTAETLDAQFNISMNGTAQFPLFETVAYTGLGLNSGDMNFPVFTGVAYTGARSSVQEHPKFGLSGSMKVQYPFTQAAKFPKLSVVATMTVGKVANGDADFPKFSGTGTMTLNPQMTQDANFPVFGGSGQMRSGGRFTNYVLRYVR